MSETLYADGGKTDFSVSPWKNQEDSERVLSEIHADESSTVMEKQTNIREELTALQKERAQWLDERCRLSEELVNVRAQLAEKGAPQHEVRTSNTATRSKEII